MYSGVLLLLCVQVYLHLRLEAQRKRQQRVLAVEHEQVPH